MNISPPRATAERKVDSVPKVKARMRKSESRNMGCAERPSIAAKAARLATEPARRISTLALPQPVAEPPAGRMP